MRIILLQEFLEPCNLTASAAEQNRSPSIEHFFDERKTVIHITLDVLGIFQFFPAVSGFFLGMVSMLFLQKLTEIFYIGAAVVGRNQTAPLYFLVDFLPEAV